MGVLGLGVQGLGFRGLGILGFRGPEFRVYSSRVGNHLPLFGYYCSLFSLNGQPGALGYWTTRITTAAFGLLIVI